MPLNKDEETIAGSIPFYGLIEGIEDECKFEINSLLNCMNNNQDTWAENCVQQMLTVNLCAEKKDKNVLKYREACAGPSRRMFRCIKNQKGNPEKCKEDIDDSMKCYMNQINIDKKK